MSTFNISFTADAGNIVIGNKTYGPPAELSNNDVKTNSPLAFAVAQEFVANGTTSGTVTVTAA